MRTVDLDNLDLASARRAIERARKLKPWCHRDRKDSNTYRIRARRSKRQIKKNKPRRISFVTFIFTKHLRLATCTCDGSFYGSVRQLLCWHIARAYFNHVKNLQREAEKDQEAKAA